MNDCTLILFQRLTALALIALGVGCALCYSPATLPFAALGLIGLGVK